MMAICAQNERRSRDAPPPFSVIAGRVTENGRDDQQTTTRDRAHPRRYIHLLRPELAVHADRAARENVDKRELVEQPHRAVVVVHVEVHAVHALHGGVLANELEHDVGCEPDAALLGRRGRLSRVQVEVDEEARLGRREAPELRSPLDGLVLRHGSYGGHMTSSKNYLSTAVTVYDDRGQL